MTAAMAASAVSPQAADIEPFPIFQLAHRYLLYDVNTVTHVRKEYNITGVLVGTLPQAPQQNVFLGLPLELMPEEARLLVEKGVAYIADDNSDHKRKFLSNGLGLEERKAYQSALRKQGQTAALEASKKSEEKKQAGLKKAGVTPGATENWNDIPEDMFAPGPRRGKPKKSPRPSTTDLPAAAAHGAPNGSSVAGPPKLPSPAIAGEDEDVLFASSSNSFPIESLRSPNPSVAPEASEATSSGPEPFAITPTATFPPLKHLRHASSKDEALPKVPSSSYPLYKYMHENGYFMMPGLRFGCQFSAYPGDPLRFHSHFLCNGKEWDEEFDLIDLVGGGRLGTGVKKGFVVGGEEKSSPSASSGEAVSVDVGKVRAFGLEWAGM